MNRLAICTATLFTLASMIGCGDDDTPRGDSGVGPRMDAGPDFDAGRVLVFDAGPVPRDGTCTPTIEICGDRMDQNCNGRDTSCGDSDMDGVEACRMGDDLSRCDCDDDRMDVRPPFGMLPGSAEMCDGVDNDCDGRVDEAAACCDGCASLGAARDRADECMEDGTCDCSSDPAIGPCAEGQACCVGGCTDLATDVRNCGFCGAACTAQADSCVARNCACGDGPPCDKAVMCSAGGCGG